MKPNRMKSNHKHNNISGIKLLRRKQEFLKTLEEILDKGNIVFGDTNFFRGDWFLPGFAGSFRLSKKSINSIVKENSNFYITPLVLEEMKAGIKKLKSEKMKKHEENFIRILEKHVYDPKDYSLDYKIKEEVSHKIINYIMLMNSKDLLRSINLDPASWQENTDLELVAYAIIKTISAYIRITKKNKETKILTYILSNDKDVKEYLSKLKQVLKKDYPILFDNPNRIIIIDKERAFYNNIIR